MAEFLRLTHEQKIAFRDVFNTYEKKYNTEDSQKLNEIIKNGIDKFDGLPKSTEYVFISKPEVHPAIWTALKKAHIGKIEDFENGDLESKYRKSMKVEKHLLEALLALLVAIIESVTKVFTGKGADDGAESPKSRRKHRQDAENSYEN